MNSRQLTHASVLVSLNPVSSAIAVALGSTVATATPAMATEEIVVTATRRETSMQDVPYNIAAITGDQLENQRITDLNDFARQVPGLTLTDQGSRDSDLLTVRGLNTSNIDAPEIFLGNSGGDTVATYIGDIPLYVDMKLADIERVEVLIGPQGTLYGAGTLGGAVRYIPKRPDLDEMSLDLHGSLYGMSHSGDYGYKGDAVFNVPIISDRLAFRGMLGKDEVPGYIDSNFIVGRDQAGLIDPDINGPDADSLRQIKDTNDAETVFAKAALLWQINDDVDATLSYFYQDVDSGGRSADSNVALITGEYVYGRRFLEPKERENQLTSLEINWDLGFATLTSATGYSLYEDSGSRDQTDLLLDIGYYYEDFPAFAAFTSDTAKEETFTQEIRLVSNNAGPVNWIVGGFYSDFELDAISEELTPNYPGSPEFQFNVLDFSNRTLAEIQATTGDLEYRNLVDQSLEQLAIFGEVGVQINDIWQITAGARWFEYEDDTKASTRFPFFDDAQPPFPLAPPVKEDDVIFKLNTSVDIDHWNSVWYATISEGYRNGRSNGLSLCVPSQIQSVCATADEQRVEADTTVNYETGIKGSWLDDSLIINANIYFIDWDKIRVSTITSTGLQPIDTNGSKAESQGLEVYSSWQINDAWAVEGSYSYNEVELTQIAPDLISGRFGDVDGLPGDRLPGTPENTGSFNVHYTQQTLGGLTLDARYGLSTISDVLTKVGGKNGGETLGGFTVHNASVSISDAQWTATLFADNLTDKYAVTGVRRDRDFIGLDGGLGNVELRSYYQNIIQPRTIGVDFRYSFDL